MLLAEDSFDVLQVLEWAVLRLVVVALTAAIRGEEEFEDPPASVFILEPAEEEFVEAVDQKSTPVVVLGDTFVLARWWALRSL